MIETASNPKILIATVGTETQHLSKIKEGGFTQLYFLLSKKRSNQKPVYKALEGIVRVNWLEPVR